MGALATHLSKLERVQKLAERLRGCVFPALQSCCAVNFRIFMDVGHYNYFVQLLLLLLLIHID